MFRASRLKAMGPSNTVTNSPITRSQRVSFAGAHRKQGSFGMKGVAMRVPVELDPDVEDEAPAGETITVYDERHFVAYLRLLDAKAEGADWKEVARIVLHRDPVSDEARTRRCWESHLARAQWLSREGYRRILEQAAANKA